MIGYRHCRLLVWTWVLLGCLLLRPPLVSAAAATSSPDIASAVIDADRTRKPDGKLTIAVHVSLSPKWLNPQEIPAVMAYELLWKLHDNMIKGARGNIYSYALAEFYERARTSKRRPYGYALDSHSTTAIQSPRRM